MDTNCLGLCGVLGSLLYPSTAPLGSWFLEFIKTPERSVPACTAGWEGVAMQIRIENLKLLTVIH
jgi:hypothetical protein